MKYIWFLFASLAVSGLINSAAAEIKSKSNWSLLCNKNKNCRVYANIKSDKNIIASSVSLIKAKVSNKTEKQIVGVIHVPLGLHIPSGVKVTVDNKISFKANLIECKNKGCRALFATSEKLLGVLNAGEKLTILIVDSKTRKTLKLSYSLQGFPKVYQKFAGQ